MMGPTIEEVSYNNGKVKGFRVWDITAKELVHLLLTSHVPHTAMIIPECDCYTGCEGPNRYLEILWDV